MDSFNKSQNESLIDDAKGHSEVIYTLHVLTYLIIAISLPLTLLAIYALYSMVRNDHVAPIYVINLLISDLIQLCSMIFWEAQHDGFKNYHFFIHAYYYGFLASVGFMVCVALERFLVIACPLWYRFRRNIKISVSVCVVVWALALSPILTYFGGFHYKVHATIIIMFQLLPLPLFIFFLGGTLKALSASKSVRSDEKRRIVGILVLVLLIYTLLFLPNIIFYILKVFRNIEDTLLYNLSMMLVRLSPLADLALYIFMRKGAIDKLLTSLCCCIMNSNEDSSSSV